ncbi:MAG TPA: protein-disulfide reductase DsbD domain-containing protein [Caulobacteraceae bacterium]
MLLLILVLASPNPGRTQPVRAAHIALDLAAQTETVAPGSTVYVAVVQTLDQGWHTYWRNPGDAGEPTTIRWTLPAGWSAGGIVWPAPRRLPVGPIMNYGYEGRVLLASPVEAPANASPGEHAEIAAKVDYLVCAEVCIPGSANLKIDLPIAAGAPRADPRWGPAIAADLAAAPKPGRLQAAFRRESGAVKLAITGAAVSGARGSDAYFYPFDDKLIDQARPQGVELGPRGLTLSLTPGAAFTGGADPSMARGVLEVDGKALEVDAGPGPPPPGASGLGPPAPVRASLGIAVAVAFAFVGGIILNLMPCVFPILSMKVAALARHGDDPRAARSNAVAFVAGVVMSFLALAAVLIAARAGGAAIGWGFQLQSPLVVAALALVMFAAALNLSGLYDVGGSVQGLGSGLARRGGLVGSLLTGALAVVVAAPCTAPFMGPALGYALTQPGVVVLAVFAALGLGFAAPFAIFSFSPALLRHLPAPGPWMDITKKILAFPLYASAAWLVWVLAQQTGSAGLARMLAAIVVMGAGAWIFGLAQRRRAAGAGATSLLALAAVAGVLCLALITVGRKGSPLPVPGRSTAAAITSEPYSAQRLAALRAQGRPVLVNFTAAWCVTCQVNERLALSSQAVAAAFRRSGAAYLVADWTNHDPVIAKALAEQGRIGVPLYLVYGAGGGAAKVLPQILTPRAVVEALDWARLNSSSSRAS